MHTNIDAETQNIDIKKIYCYSNGKQTQEENNDIKLLSKETKTILYRNDRIRSQTNTCKSWADAVIDNEEEMDYSKQLVFYEQHDETLKNKDISTEATIKTSDEKQ